MGRLGNGRRPLNGPDHKPYTHLLSAWYIKGSLSRISNPNHETEVETRAFQCFTSLPPLRSIEDEGLSLSLSRYLRIRTIMNKWAFFLLLNEMLFEAFGFVYFCSSTLQIRPPDARRSSRLTMTRNCMSFIFPVSFYYFTDSHS